MPQHLHIVCFDVPYPADYGGVFDVFYKLPVLYEMGVHIHLHCFEYGRGKQAELEKYCVSVQYYRRVKRLSFTLPYIISSRRNKSLLSDLLKDDYPVLMEGVHCSYPLSDKRFEGRKMMVRLHNTEFVYYRYLYTHTKQVFRKLYYGIESFLLKKYEQRIASKAVAFRAMSNADVEYYRQHFGCKTISYLPLFIPPSWRVKGKEGIGQYCIYHGKLEVEENEAAVVWLLKYIIAQLPIPFIIAGKNPSPFLIQQAARYKHVMLIGNASQTQMEQLIEDAHIHVLPSFNATGIKIKLLTALYNGRHCIVNTAGVKGTHLASLCHVADTADDMRRLIEQLIAVPFTPADIAQRKQQLQNEFDNTKNARAMLEFL